MPETWDPRRGRRPGSVRGARGRRWSPSRRRAPVPGLVRGAVHRPLLVLAAGALGGGSDRPGRRGGRGRERRALAGSALPGRLDEAAGSSPAGETEVPAAGRRGALVGEVRRPGTFRPGEAGDVGGAGRGRLFAAGGGAAPRLPGRPPAGGGPAAPPRPRQPAGT